MTKLFKVETVGAIVDGKPLGSTVELSEKTANHLESIGYVRIIGEVKPRVKKAAAAPKKPAKTTSKKKTEK